MARRKQLTAEVSVWHANGTTAKVATVSDVVSVKVAIPELDWLHKVSIDINPRTGELAIRVDPSSEDAFNSPELRVRPGGSFDVRS